MWLFSNSKQALQSLKTHCIALNTLANGVGKINKNKVSLESNNGGMEIRRILFSPFKYLWTREQFGYWHQSGSILLILALYKTPPHRAWRKPYDGCLFLVISIVLPVIRPTTMSWAGNWSFDRSELRLILFHVFPSDAVCCAALPNIAAVIKT